MTKILCVGGGSGGHITPIVAVVDQLLKIKSDQPQIRVWVDKKFASRAIQLLSHKVRVDVIASGKLRRYANLKWWYRYFSWYHIRRTHLPNLIDFFKIFGGFWQSFFKLRAWRPDVVFLKGGYVGLPVGWAAHWLKIPLVIHDSDTVPGLTNRLLAPLATAIGTGAPVKNYPNYPKDRTQFIGIPVRPEFQPLSDNAKSAVKKSLGLRSDKAMIFAVGGGLGASDLNRLIIKTAPDVIRQGRQILLLTGQDKNCQLVVKTEPDLMIKPFLADDYAKAVASADLVITRAGATSLAELAMVKAAVILVPSPYLAGDHQTKNAAVYDKAGAAVCVDQRQLDDHPEKLITTINKVLDNKEFRQQLSANLAKFAKPDALNQMIEMILGASRS
jgi:UDP-N-acetylglucosamine--N-acetylmuramyl-(pentapeptide) pyrophosphoryl-undecaprenol N-acetylglucosamine transferase